MLILTQGLLMKVPIKTIQQLDQKLFNPSQLHNLQTIGRGEKGSLQFIWEASKVDQEQRWGAQSNSHNK